MPTETVLVQIVTAANMAGVEEAKAGFLGMQRSTLLLAAGLGVLVAGGKAMLDTWQKVETSNRLLEQSVGGNKAVYEQLQGTFDKWVSSNKRYVSDQADAKAALGQLKRAQLSNADAMRVLNDALDLSVIKHISVSDAATLLIKVWAGSPKVLKELGISTHDYNRIMKSHHTTAQKHAALLHLIETRTKDGRKAIDDTKQSSNDLNNSWIELSKKGGPVLEAGLKFLIDRANDLYDWFDRLGKNDALWSAISDRLTKIGGWIRDNILIPATTAYNNVVALWGGKQAYVPLDTRQQAEVNAASQRTGGFGKGGRAGGGLVMPGGAYTVGERGPETLVMGSSGGRVIPSGGGELHIHMHGMVIDGPAMERFFREGLQRFRFAPGT